MRTPDVRRHLTKVYGTIMAGMGFAAAGAVAGGLAPGLAMVGLIGYSPSPYDFKVHSLFRSFAGILGIIFTGKEKVTLRQNLFLGVTALMGMGLGPLLAATAPGFVFHI